MNDLDFLDKFFVEVRKNFSYDYESLYFHPTSPAQLVAVKGKEISMTVITSDMLFQGIKYKLVQAGEIKRKNVCIFDRPSYTESDLNKWLLQRTADDVVVIPVVPNDIPVVGGVICGEIIPPLCHVALLCQNRKTPCCFAKDCLKLMASGRFPFNETRVANGVITKTGFYLDGEISEGVESAQQPQVDVPIRIDDELVTSVIDKIKQHNMTSVIFRSSTNAEDLTGFNGAGLYESVPLHGNDVHDHQKVGEAIKKVWASVWNVKAVKERNHYKIAHSDVNMAVLVQPFIDDHMKSIRVHYNGVCITHDVVQHGVKHGFMVNCFPGHKLRATNYYKGQIPEQTVLLLGRSEKSIDIQVKATATGQLYSLIAQEDASQMVSVFGSLHSSMLGKPHKLDDTTALDIEFIVVSSNKDLRKRDIVVLQARPYAINVVDTEKLEQELDHFATLNSSFEYLQANKLFLKS